MNYISSCYLRRRKRKPLPTAKSYAKSLCGKVAESVAHALAGCSSLAQTKVPTQAWWSFEDSVFWAPVRTLVNRRWSTTVLTGDAKTSLPEHHEWGLFWDIPIYAQHNEVRANRIDARLVSQERKEDKTLKYGPMMWELKQRYNGYRWLLYTPRDVGEEATTSKSTGRTWAEAEVPHLKHFEHCQNI